MDPNANLAEQEWLIVNYRAKGRVSKRMSELREALVVWLNQGGFEPEWSKYPKAAKYYGR